MDRTKTKIFERVMWVLENHREEFVDIGDDRFHNEDGAMDNGDYAGYDQDDIYHDDWRDEDGRSTDKWFIPKDDWSGGTMKVTIGEEYRSPGNHNGWRQLINRYELDDLYKDIL